MAIRTFITPTEITAMISKATNLRDKMVLTFLSDVGCRVSEMLALTPANIDLDRQEVIIPHLKRGTKKKCPKCLRIAGRSTRFCARCGADLSKVTAEGLEERTRIVSIGKDTSDILREYLSRIPIEPDKPLVPLTRQMIYKIVRDAAISIGLSGKMFLNPETGKKHYVHPHDFRSALAVSWLDFAGSDATKQKALQDHLGHKSFETTMRYNKLTPGAVRTVSDEVRSRRFGGK